MNRYLDNKNWEHMYDPFNLDLTITKQEHSA